MKDHIAIIGGGNIGIAIAKGLKASGKAPGEITITRRKLNFLTQLKEQGFDITTDNIAAIKKSRVVIIAVTPQQLTDLLKEIASAIDPQKHIVISVVSAITIDKILQQIDKKVATVRAMPNTAIAIGESMTCLAAKEKNEAIELAQAIFNTVGKTLVIEENLMEAATSLCACGVAFFLRAVRAASQGGIEIGFHSEEAIAMAAQTARGAASLLLDGNHPESEIDKVTTPRGITITGLNEMEHRGFSSAFIKGITTSANKASGLSS